MIGICVCGGSGRRLGALGSVVHKSLLPCGNRTFLEAALERCVLLGCDEIIVLVDHLGEQVRQFLADERVLGQCPARVRVVTLSVSSTSEAVQALDAELSSEFVYTHGNIDVSVSDLHLLGGLSLADGEAAAFLVGPAATAPTHPAVQMDGGRIVSFVEGRGLQSLRSVGVGRVMLAAARSTQVGPYPFELGFNGLLEGGGVVRGATCATAWRHLESLEFFGANIGRLE